MRMLWIILALLVPVQSWAASFDCAKASTKLEKLICSDKELNALDDALGKAYKKALSGAADRDALKNGQKEWLKNTLRPCDIDKACLVPAYKNRIAALDQGQEAVTLDTGLYGTYAQQHSAQGGGSMYDVTDCLTIMPDKGNRVRFYLHVESDEAGRSCSVEGVALANGANLEFRRTAQVNTDAPVDCILRFIIDGKTISVDDVYGYCQVPLYCGVGAGLSASFPLEKVSGTCGDDGLKAPK